MRFIENVSQETISMLQRIYKQSKHHRVRQRAHCMLLSFQGHTTTELVEIFQVDRITIYHWFDAWELQRLTGLYCLSCRTFRSTYQYVNLKTYIKINGI